MPNVLVPRRAWPADRYPDWAVDALRAAGAEVRDHGWRCDVAVLPAMRPAAPPRVRARRVIALVDAPVREGDERLQGADVVATSAALAAQWGGARVVRPVVAPPPAVSPAASAPSLRLASIGPLHWSAGHEHAVVAAAALIARGTEVALRIVGDGPAREAVLFAAFDLGIEDAVTIVADVPPADVIVVPAVEDRAWTGLLHAQACGIPAVVSDLPTLRELGAETLVPPRDPAALADAIAGVEARPTQRADVTDLEACGRALLG